jgi:iron uptake system EfeUOB component EfeO/EfeM
MDRFYKQFFFICLPIITSCTWNESSSGYEKLDYSEPPKIIQDEELDNISKTANDLESNNFADKDVNDFLNDYTQFLKDYVDAEKKGDKEKMKKLSTKSREINEKIVKIGEKFSEEDKENNVSKKKIIESEYPVGVEKK